MGITNFLSKSIILISFLFLQFSIYAGYTQQTAGDLKATADKFFNAYQWDSAAHYYNLAANDFLNAQEIRQYLYCKNQEAFARGIQYKNEEALEITNQVLRDFPDSLKAAEYDVYFFWKASLFNFRLGNHVQAYDYGIKTRDVAEEYAILKGYMKNEILDILTTSARYLGLYDTGLSYAFEKSEFNESQKDFINLSHSYNSTGLLYKRLKDNNRAIHYLKESMSLREQHAPQWSPYVMQNIAELYHENYRLDSAEFWYNKTLNKLNSQVEKENLLHSVIYAGLAQIKSFRGEHASALCYINECIDIRKRYESEDNAFFQNFVKDKAEILIAMGRFPESDSILSGIKSGFLNSESSPQRKVSYFQTTAFNYSERGQFNKALQEYQKGVIILSKNFTDTSFYELPSREDSFYGKEILLDVTGKKANIFLKIYHQSENTVYLNAVVEHYDFALDLIDLIMRDQSSLSSISGLYRQNRPMLETAIESLVAFNEIQQDTKNLLKISEFMEASRMNHLKAYYLMNRMINMGGIPDSIINQKKLLENRIRFLEFDSLIAENIKNEELFELKRDLDQITFFLKQEQDKKRNILDISLGNELQKVRRKLRKNQLLVQYYYGDSTLYCLSTTKRKHKLSVIPWNDKEREVLNKVLTMIKDPGKKAETDEISKQLYSDLQLESHVDDKVSEIIIIPDRELNYLPFEVLRDKEEKYLIQDYTIYYSNSLFFFNNKWNSQEQKARDSFLGLAPFSTEEKESNSYELKNVRSGFRALPASGKEIQNISELFKGQAIIGTKASETYFKQNAIDKGIVHLATHTQLDDNNPMYNRVLLASNQMDEDDGDLYTFEIFPLQLNSELVTLSACNTGIGKFFEGEGIVSLATGFKSAGVDNIVMSLWSLPDDATSKIMEKFYFHLWSGEGKATALRNAKLGYLQDSDENTSAPFFWAAAVYSGENTPIGNRGLSNLWWIIGGFTLVAMIFARLMNRALRKNKRSNPILKPGN